MTTSAPNQSSPGNHAAGSFPLTRGGNPINPPNNRREPDGDGDMLGGDGARGESPSPITPPNHRFAVGSSRMPQPPSAVTPGAPGTGNPLATPMDMSPMMMSMPVADMTRSRSRPQG